MNLFRSLIESIIDSVSFILIHITILHSTSKLKVKWCEGLLTDSHELPFALSELP